MADPLTRLRLDYAPIMLRYLAQEDEAGLQAAYELGRTAMLDSVSLLEVVRVHNETFLAVHRSARDLEESQRLAGAAAAPLLELVATFEMAQRGFMEGRRPPTSA